MPRLASLTSQILTGTGIKKDLSLVYTLDNPNPFGTSDTDLFGNKIGISDTHAIVGTYLEDEGVTTSSGKAYIYNLATGALVHTLDNPNPFDTTQSDYFGISVDIDGNYAVVGAYLEDEATGTASGKAYIFNVTTGALVYTLDNPNTFYTAQDDFFGRAVAISGDRAIVSATGEDTAIFNNTGKVYIFDVTTGTRVRTITNPGSTTNSFGLEVDISGNRAIVSGDRQTDADGGTLSGQAYIFNITSGDLLQTLDNPNPFSTGAGDQFGAAVAITSNYAVVGAPGEDESDGTDSGKAYIFK